LPEQRNASIATIGALKFVGSFWANNGLTDDKLPANSNHYDSDGSAQSGLGVTARSSVELTGVRMTNVADFREILEGIYVFFEKIKSYIIDFIYIFKVSGGQRGIRSRAAMLG
jgi:hypothetical protein